MSMNTRFVIDEINDRDFDPSFVPPKVLKDYKVRKAARGLLLNSEGKIAILFVSKENYHKLPGGGVEPGETTKEAFIREIKEETGCECKILEDKPQNSIVLEERDNFKLLQISYIFYSEVIGEPQELQLTQEEIEEDFKLKWVTLSEAIELITKDKPLDYEGNFIQRRDLAVLNFYKDNN